ncbi:MAG: hypothetical protein CMO81_10265 [Waddliaceae bacterium]|nr:hypothetical protein [Waddliaceae bacterium]
MNDIEHHVESESLLCRYPQFSSLIKKQISNIDPVLFRQQKLLCGENTEKIAATISPFNSYEMAQEQSSTLGESLLKKGKLACLLVAGGQGSRLGFKGPKGKFPLTTEKNKSLFQYFAEKVLAASRQVERDLHIAIMTSEQNHEETLEFFQKHKYFGLKKEQIDFFTQKSLPLLNTEKQLFLSAPGQIAMGAAGNGTALYDLTQAGITQRWKNLGIEYVHFIQVDNPLSDPFDAKLLSFHVSKELDISVKCALRKDPEESVGILVEKDNRVAVVEYSEIDERERKLCDGKGQLIHRCANLSQFCFNLDFILKVAGQGLATMPLHIASKTSLSWEKESNEKKIAVWKSEYFIFDVMAYSSKVAALLYSRKDCFAPLKNASGRDSIEEVRNALLQSDRKAYEALSGCSAPSRVFELALDFYYPSPKMAAYWWGRSLPERPYIDAFIDMQL